MPMAGKKDRGKTKDEVIVELAELRLRIAGLERSESEEVIKKAKNESRVSETKYRFLFENNPFPMWAYDIAGLTFLAVNDAANRHYGYLREEFPGMTIKDIRLTGVYAALLLDVLFPFPLYHRSESHIG
jgi:PAS domain-containing protein